MRIVFTEIAQRELEDAASLFMGIATENPRVDGERGSVRLFGSS